jgi:hypothetical protein
LSPVVQKILEDLSKRGLLVTRSGKGWLSQCPAHEDMKQSLSVGEGADGKALLNCFAGCELSAICEVMGWVMADLFPQPARGAMNIVAEYSYLDENNELLSQVVRLEPKSFRQRRPDGNGGWVYQLGDVRRVLYRLPELKGKRKGVVFVEGEKDADALWKLKIPATTNLGGASAWRPELVDNLKWAGVKRVVILPDNDAPGRKHARNVARDCHAAGIAVTICELPGLAEKGDVSDFLAAAQYPKGDLTRAVQEHGVRWDPDSDAPTPEPPVAEEGGDWLPGGKGLDETELSFLVEGMVPLGMMGSISGRDGRGKSLLGLEITKAMLTGEPLFGEFAVKQGVVYLVLLDDPENLISARLKTMGIFGHPNLYVKVLKHFEGQKWNEERVEVLKDLAANISRRSRELHDGVPVLVLLDALYLFVPHGGKSGADQGNSAGAMLPIMEAFDKIARPGHVTVGVVIHNNKADTDIQGSQSIRNMLKWVLMLSLPKKYEKDRQGGRVTPDRILQLGKIKTGQPAEWGFRLIGQPDGTVVWTSVDLEEFEKSDKKKRKTERRQKMVEWIRFFLEPGARTSTEVYAAGWEDGRYTNRELESPDFADSAGIDKYHPTHEGPWYWRLRENTA